MPMYDYECAACGSFSSLRPMVLSGDPCDCPTCGAPAPRVILAAPRIAGMDPGRRAAFETNERSAHAPKHSSGHRHGPGCGCGSGKSGFVGGRGGGGTGKAAAKSFPNARPWMISH